MTKIRRTPAYLAVVYHDTEENASEDSMALGTHPSLQEARQAILEVDRAYWQTGSIHYGFRVQEKESAGHLWLPEGWEDDDRETPWFVGTDGKADR